MAIPLFSEFYVKLYLPLALRRSMERLYSSLFGLLPAAMRPLARRYRPFADTRHACFNVITSISGGKPMRSGGPQ